MKDTGSAPWFPSSLTKHAKSAVQEAGRIAGSWEGVGTVHLLRGLLEVEDSLSFKLLRSFDPELPDRLRRRLLEPHDAIDEGDRGVPSAETLVALELAVEAAGRLRCELGYFVGCGHILAGLIREPAGTAGQILRSCGLGVHSFEPVLAAALVGYGHAKSAGGRRT